MSAVTSQNSIHIRDAVEKIVMLIMKSEDITIATDTSFKEMLKMFESSMLFFQNLILLIAEIGKSTGDIKNEMKKILEAKQLIDTLSASMSYQKDNVKKSIDNVSRMTIDNRDKIMHLIDKMVMIESLLLSVRSAGDDTVHSIKKIDSQIGEYKSNSGRIT